MKKLALFITLFSLILVLGLCSCGKKPTEGLRYNLLPDKTYEVSIGEATEVEEIVIPSTYKDVEVTKIGDFGFFGATSIESVRLPKTITSIGESAFEGCTSLKKINFPDSLTDIGIFAFASCEALEEAVLPEGMSKIGDGAFCGCTGLKAVKITSMEIYSLGASLLADCTSLEEVTVPFVGRARSSDDGFKYIFGGIAPKTIKSVKILSGELKDGAFKGFSSIEKIEITKEVADAGIVKEAFKGCTSLKYNEYGNCLYLGSKKEKHLALIQAESTDIKTCKIAKGTKIICQGAFEGCENLEKIKLGKNVEIIKTGAFKNCRNLQDIYIPEGVKRIEEDAFNGCIRLTIHCESEEMPKGEGFLWSKDWNPLNRPVVWGE